MSCPSADIVQRAALILSSDGTPPRRGEAPVEVLQPCLDEAVPELPHVRLTKSSGCVQERVLRARGKSTNCDGDPNKPSTYQALLHWLLLFTMPIGAPQGAHWVFDHAGEARCRVNGTRRSRCDRDRAPRRSTVAISGRGTTLQLRQCPPDPRCDLPAGPIARPGRLGPVPPAPRFATVGHGTPRPAPSGGSSPETPLMSENEFGVA